ncbi:thiamine pyrophosphate-dependent dehydrogenase E1 component subunit alpha [candidate division WOR-3 bacterium]|nr:thiamine pyrophosphate-dependent dehydrogenase E1 component subunit alpha [candidate division WOR-3 bacterium]
MAECASPELIQYLDYEGNPIKDFEDPFTEADLKKLYYTMALSRAADEKAANLVRQGKSFFYAQASGHEAAQAASVWALGSQDWIFPYHRSVPVLFARGYTLAEFFLEVMGKAGAVNKGRQMPNHFGKRSLKLVTPSSTVGNQIPQAVGTAFASMLKGEDAVSVVYFGEGATSQGDFHVAMNFAGVYNTPSIFFCENNQYAISVPLRLQAAAHTISMEACGYEFPGYQVDGNDFMAVYLTTKKTVERGRKGKGPSLIEAMTYRLGAHSSSDDASRYRSDTELEEWKRKGPIKRLLGYIKHKGYYSEAWQEETDDRIKEDIEAALTRAEEESIPEPQTMFSDVFAETTRHLERQKTLFLAHLEKYPPTSDH